MPDDVTAADLLAGLTGELHSDTGDEEMTPEEWEDAWGAGAERRLAELESGQVRGVPAEEVFRKLREKYG